MRQLIRGVELVNPKGMSGETDILIEEGRIAGLGHGLPADGCQVIAGKGLWAAPGLIDIHVHFRDPGLTHKEDIFTGCAAAAAGGFTAVCCMPNTKPPIDCPDVLDELRGRAGSALAKLYPVACITQEMRGEELCDFAALKAHGAVAVSDDGRPVENARLMQRAMEACGGLGLPVISHCEDLAIIDGGIMNLGAVSRELGVKGMDRTSEESVTAREIALAQGTGAPIHIAHVSTAGSVALIRDAKRRGVPVTCETGPHYFTLTEDLLRGRDANFRMNPPLRTERDREAVLEGLCDGTIDAIATDHAPHTPEEKREFETAPNGIIGLQTSFPAAYTALVKTGLLTLNRLVELMSVSPAALLHLPGGCVKEGGAADLVLFSTEEETVLTRENNRSRSCNSPYLGVPLTGRIKLTMCGGRVTYREIF